MDKKKDGSTFDAMTSSIKGLHITGTATIMSRADDDEEEEDGGGCDDDDDDEGCNDEEEGCDDDGGCDDVMLWYRGGRDHPYACTRFSSWNNTANDFSLWVVHFMMVIFPLSLLLLIIIIIIIIIILCKQYQ